MTSKSASGSELIIPQFASPMRDAPAYVKNKIQPPGLFSPFTAASQRFHVESQQAAHVNMLLQQLLVRAAFSNQQNVSRPLGVPPLYGAMGLTKSSMFSGTHFPLPAFHPPRVSGLENAISPNVLLTPPLSERSVDSNTERPTSQDSPTDPPLKSTKDSAAGRKRAHKGTEYSQKSKARKEGEKYKASRKLDLNEQSPISGILIKRKTKGDKSNSDDISNSEECHGDIDARFNVVDKSEESKKKLAKIKNVIGDFVCRLCDRKFADVYELAEHRCPSIIYIEYKCPECFKVFNCPANLASHRRWHKPRPATSTRPAANKCNNKKEGKHENNKSVET